MKMAKPSSQSDRAIFRMGTKREASVRAFGVQHFGLIRLAPTQHKDGRQRKEQSRFQGRPFFITMRVTGGGKGETIGKS